MNNNEFKQITSTEELLTILKEEPNTSCEFFVQLPLARSWKTISLSDDNSIWVLNQIDDSEEFISVDTLKDSRIGNFIQRGKFYFAWR